MHKLISVFSLIILMFSLALGAAESIPSSTLVQRDEDVPEAVFSDPAKVIVLSPQQDHFIIRIRSNPTTGYSWFIKGYDRELLQLSKHSFTPPDTSLVGAPGVENFEFTVKKAAIVAPVTTDIVLKYMRPWEANKKNAGKDIKFTLVISPASTAHNVDPISNP